MRLAKLLLAGLLMTAALAAWLPADAAGKTTARQRMQNRLLLAKARIKHPAPTPVIRGDRGAKAALRAQNRAILQRHPEWFSAPFPANTLHLQPIVEKAIRRLQAQLGKPYVWGGETPEEGFDCSGLIFYAFNPLLAARLPRTANEMYHYRQARDVADSDLKRGDLLFFGIHSREKADHVGVYLGNNRFIESPRTGEHIRISDLTDAFWQTHYLGGRRILLSSTVRFPG